VALTTGHHVDLIALDLAAENDLGIALDDPSRSCEAITWVSSGSIPSSWAICSLERFRPMQ
jgi:hypothetical protein